MKLAQYLFKMFFPLLFATLALFVLGFEIVELFMDIWKYILNEVPAKQVATILWYYLPKTLVFALPLSVLFATCYMLCNLCSKNELVALFASGVSYLRFMLPLFIFSAVLSAGFLFFEDKVVVPSYSNYKTLKNSVLNITENKNNDNIVIRAEDGNVIYKVDIYEDELQRLVGVFLIIRTEEKKLEGIVQARMATWDEKGKFWRLSGPEFYEFLEGEMKLTAFPEKYQKRFTEPPDTFKNNNVDIETISIKEAQEYIAYLRKTGLPSGEALSVYYKKFSFPWVILIVTMLAAALSGRTKKNVMIISLTLSVSAAVLFYVLQMCTMLFAKFSIISPMSGAWFPVITFLIISILLLRYTKT